MRSFGVSPRCLMGWRRRIGAVLLLALGGVAGCRESVIEPVGVSAITIVPVAAGLRVGQSQRMEVTLKSVEGWPLPPAAVSWATSDGSVLTITTDGQVTAVKRGSSTVTATAGGLSATTIVTVVGVQSISIPQDTLSIPVLEQLLLTVSVQTDAGISVTPTWVSRDTLVARIDASGRVTARRLGVTWVVASAEGLADSVRVQVTPVTIIPPPSTASAPITTAVFGGAVSLTIPVGATSLSALTAAPVPVPLTDDRVPSGLAYVFGPEGTQFAKPITISMRFDPAVVPAAKRALLRLHLVQGTTLTEVPGGVVDLTGSRVAAPVSLFSTYAVVVPADPSQVAVTAGAGQSTFVGYEVPTAPTVIVRDAQGRPVPRVKVSFDITAGGGTFRGGATSVSDTALTGTDGTAILAAKWRLGSTPGVNTVGIKVFSAAGAVAVTTTLSATAQSNPVARIAVSPDTATVVIGSTRQLAAILYDARDSVLTDRPVSWSSSSTALALVTSAGLVTAMRSGVATITASSEGRSATSRVTIIDGYPTTGLLAVLTFDGNTADSSGRGNHFTNSGGTFVADRQGRTGSAISFEGNATLASRPWADFPRDSLTVALWFRNAAEFTFSTYAYFKWGASAAQTGDRLQISIDQNSTRCTVPGDGFLLSWVAGRLSGQLVDSTAAGRCLTRSAVTQWRHVVMTVSNGTLRIYQDGVLWYTSLISAWTPSSTAVLLGALDNISAGNGAARVIDSFAVWNRALTLAEVRDLYASKR